MFLVSTEGILAATIMILGRNLWGYCYSSEEKVVGYVGEMLLLVATSHVLDGIQSVISGLSTFLGSIWHRFLNIIKNQHKGYTTFVLRIKQFK